MKKIFYFLLMAGFVFGFTACSDDDPITDEPQTEVPEDNGTTMMKTGETIQAGQITQKQEIY